MSPCPKSNKDQAIDEISKIIRNSLLYKDVDEGEQDEVVLVCSNLQLSNDAKSR